MKKWALNVIHHFVKCTQCKESGKCPHPAICSRCDYDYTFDDLVEACGIIDAEEN